VSYLRDKVLCKGGCCLLYDPDLLNDDGECRDCVSDAIELRHLQREAEAEGQAEAEHDQEQRQQQLYYRGNPRWPD
jgi:hypothetical protein